jgi:hypothetical protein
MMALAGILALPMLLGAVPAGTWRLDVTVVVGAKVPVLGETTTTTVTTSLVEIDAAGQAVARTCTVETKGPGFTSRMPPQTIRQLAPARFPVVVDGDRVTFDLGEGRLGWRGAGRIPSEAEDPRVFDLDGDGLPGARLDLDLGAMGKWTLQVVNRGRTALAGTLTAEGTVVGRPTVIESEERVLSGLPVDLPARTETIDPSRSRFVLQPASADDLKRCGPR